MEEKSISRWITAIIREEQEARVDEIKLKNSPGWNGMWVNQPGTQECNQAEITRPFQTSLHSKSSNHESARPSEKWSRVRWGGTFIGTSSRYISCPISTFPVCGMKWNERIFTIYIISVFHKKSWNSPFSILKGIKHSVLCSQRKQINSGGEAHRKLSIFTSIWMT